MRFLRAISLSVNHHCVRSRNATSCSSVRSGGCEDRERLRPRCGKKRRHQLEGNSLCCSASGQTALARAAASSSMVGRTRRQPIRASLQADRRCAEVERLSLSQRVATRTTFAGRAACTGLDSRRGDGARQFDDVPGSRACGTRRYRCEHELPHGPAWFLCPPRSRHRIAE